MTKQDAIKNLYKKWEKEYCPEETLTSEQKKAMFFNDYIVGITTYSDSLSLKFGKMIIETLTQIKNKTTYEYIKDENNYEKYILSCNFIEDWIDWGCSIRGAWFNTFDGKIETAEYLGNVGYEGDRIDITEDFINWFIEWLMD